MSDRPCRIKQTEAGPLIVQSGSWVDRGPPHAFTTWKTRADNLDRMDMVFHPGDRTHRIRASRRALARVSELPNRWMVRAEQVHGSRVADVTGVDGGDPLNDEPVVIDGVDGLVTRSSRQVLMTYAADCPLVFLHGKGPTPIVALLHASWQGIRRGILERGIEVIVEMGGSPQASTAFIGPSIRVCCYEVKQDFRRAMLDGQPSLESCFDRRDGRMYFDLQKAIRTRLLEQGIPDEQISDAGLCTFDRSDLFYSYRRDGEETGRMAGVIALE